MQYLDAMPSDAPEAMTKYVANWLGPDLSTKTLLDIGSGQGLTSLAATRLGARVTSFDRDPSSVAATRRSWMLAGEQDSWTVRSGDVLDREYMASLGKFDIVVSWGVLHHTGSLWDALDAASARVAAGGVLWIALYHRTAHSARSLRIKKLYGRLPELGRALMRGGYAAAKVGKSLVVRRRLPRLRGAYDNRGMNWWRDIEDWLGGLPYEVSSPGEILDRLQPLGFELRRLEDATGEGSNDVYLLRRVS